MRNISYALTVVCVALAFICPGGGAAGNAGSWSGDIRWASPTKHARLDGDRLVVVVPRSERANTIFGISGSLSTGGGRQTQAIRATVRARGSEIAKPAVSYHGLKFQFCIFDSMTGTSRYPNTKTFRHGSFPWSTLEVFAFLGGSDPGSVVTLSLGLQGTTGEVEFDLASLTIEPVENLFIRENADLVSCYSSDVRDMPRHRGVMLPGGRDMTEDDFREMSRWGVELARYQMVRGWGKWKNGPADMDLPEYDRWIDGRLDHLDDFVLPMAEKYGMKIVVDVHSPPGGRNPAGEMNMFFDKRFRNHFISLWQRIATRFKGRKAVYGYDLVNEPQQLRPAEFDYWSVQRDAAEAVRAIDPDIPIIVESNNMDSPAAFAYMGPMALTNVIYSVHVYVPSDYTHQGVHGGGPMRWPDAESHRDCEWLGRSLSHVRDFQLRHGARIYVGEFSAVAWAAGAERYLADCISIFEEYGWDWTYHSFRGWNGWSVEHEGPDIAHMRSSQDNPRKRALLHGLGFQETQKETEK